MKIINLIFSIFMTIFFFSSCIEDIELVNKPINIVSKTLEVKTEQNKSRSVIDFYGKHYWNPSDTIGVFGSETINAIYSLQEQNGDIATFTGNMNKSEETLLWAYYPYNENVVLEGSSISFNLLEQRKVSYMSEAPMIGLPENNGQMYFRHLGGILYLRLTGLPKNVSSIRIISLDEESPYLSGKAIVEDIYRPNSTFKIIEGTHQITYKLDSNEEEAMFYHFQIPLEVGFYKKIGLELIDNMGNIIKQNTISDIEITRGKMIEMKVLNYSEKTFAYQIDSNYLKDSDCSQYIIFSNDIHWFFDENSGEFSIYDMSPSNADNPSVINGLVDEDGKVCFYNLKDLTVFMGNYTDTTVDMTITYNDTIETFTEIPIETEEKSRGQIEADLFLVEEVFKDVLLLEQLFHKYDAKKIEDILEASSEYNDIMLDYSEGVGNAVAGKLLYDAMALHSLPFIAAFGEAAAWQTFIYIMIDVAKTIVEASYDVAKAKLYKTFVGSAYVTNMQPKQIDEYSFEAGYKLVNSSTIPKHGPVQVHHGLLVQDWPTGMLFRDNYLSYNNIHAEKLIESTRISSDEVFEKPRVFVSGYTYYTRAFIGVRINGRQIPIYYFSDVEKIVFDEAKFRHVGSSCQFADGKYNFYIDANGFCKDESSVFTMCLCKNDEIIETKTWGKTDSWVRFQQDLSRDRMNPQTMTSKDEWFVGIMSQTDKPGEFLETKKLAMQYMRAKGLMITGYRVTDTRESNPESRSLYDDNDDKTYESDIEVTIASSGTGWFSDICVATSNGHFWSKDKDDEILNENQTFIVKGTLTYNEKNPPASLSCFGVLLDGETKFNGIGTIKFSQIPIPVSDK